MMTSGRRAGILLLAVVVAIGGAWWYLRQTLASGMSVAAQRDLETIVDLVSAELEQAAAGTPQQRAGQLLERAAGANPEMVATLRRASDAHSRNIYFFDAAGRLLRLEGQNGGTGLATPPATGIVRRALAGRERAAHTGAVFEPYPGVNDEAAVGVWRWLPEVELGVVAERSHVRFARPLRWFDGLFAAFAVLLAGAGMLGLRPDFAGRLLPRSWKSAASCGPYELVRLLGQGSMSTIYLARHRRLKRTVALKRLKLHAQTDELAARFDREARLASQLVHPNIVTILDHGRAPGGGFYYTMEYIHGLTLTQWVDEHGPVVPARAVRLLRQVCAGIGALHERNLLHRDIKPDNVMAYAAHDDYDLVKLLDFGLIKDMDAVASRDLTREVRLLGTPAFMAPERLLDPRSVDPRTDLYGIGCIGFFLLTGRKPFEAVLESDLLQQIRHLEAPRVSSLSPFPVPEALDRLVAAALDKDMDRRPATAREFLKALDGIAAVVPWQSMRAKLWWQHVLPGTPAPGGA